jgi:hypothetical protein
MIRTRRSGSRRRRDAIDEYDLGARFKRWARHATSKAVTFALVHPKPLMYSSLAALTLGVTWWVVAHHRPAEPPAPSARPMRQMMRSVEEADQRVRAERGDKLGQDAQFRGVFETMRDMPVPLPTQAGKEQSQSESQVPEVQP